MPSPPMTAMREIVIATPLNVRYMAPDQERLRTASGPAIQSDLRGGAGASRWRRQHEPREWSGLALADRGPGAAGAGGVYNAAGAAGATPCRGGRLRPAGRRRADPAE